MPTLREGELGTASEMSAALRMGEVTSTELVERAVIRAEAWQPVINAFSQLWTEEALELARMVDATPRSERAPEAGTPVAVKDLFDVAGHETTGCCAAYRGTLAERDAPLVDRIRRAGAVMVGKTNQHELAAGGTNLVSACGRTGNPWDPERMTGGSSGGSAAAVAAGIAPWALGSDTGGSIRIPASMCGLFGLKPTTGALPIEGLMPLGPSLDCPGPMAATVADLRTLYALMGGSAGDAAATRELRVGLLEGFFEDVMHDEVAQAVLEAARTLEGAGVVIEAMEGRGIEDARKVWMDVCTPEFAEAHPLLKDPDRRGLVAPQVVEWLQWGEHVSPEGRRAADRGRSEIARWYRSHLEGVDALLIPTTPYPAPRADQGRVDLGGRRTVEVDDVGPGFITCSVNLSRLPALNLPASHSSQGMPIGVSLVGDENGETMLLHLASLWEEASGYRPRRPPLPTP